MKENQKVKPSTPEIAVTPNIDNRHFRMGKIPPGNAKISEGME